MSDTSASRLPLAIGAAMIAAGGAWVLFGGGPSHDPTTPPDPEAPDPPAEAAPSSPVVAASDPTHPTSSDGTPARPAGDITGADVPADLTLTLPPFPTEAVERWDTERPAAPSAEQRALLDAWADIQQAEAGLQAGQPGDRAGAEQSWIDALRTLALRDEADAASTASHLAWDAFTSGWDALVARASESGSTVDALTRAGLPTELARQVGDSGVTLVDLRLAEPSGALRVERDVLRVVFRWRWFTAMAPLAPTRHVMPADELQFVDAWRIVAGDHVEPDRRIRWINEYAAMWGSWQGLPAAFARAVVWADAGENELAEAALNEAVRDDPRLATLRDRYQTP